MRSWPVNVERVQPPRWDPQRLDLGQRDNLVVLVAQRAFYHVLAGWQAELADLRVADGVIETYRHARETAGHGRKQQLGLDLLTLWPHDGQVRRLAAGPLQRPARLAAMLADRQPADLRLQLPYYPIGILKRVIARPNFATLQPPDVLNALRTIAALRRCLAYLELKALQRGRHWRGWIRQAELGQALGISSSGVTKRRQRLAKASAGLCRIHASPKTLEIETATAEQYATELLDRRAELGDDCEWTPEPGDLIGTIVYVLMHEDQVKVDVFVQDLVLALSIGMSLRRDLDQQELTWLNFGRATGIPNRALGKPLGRHDQWATWKAVRRLTNATQLGGRHAVIPTVDQGIDRLPNTVPPTARDEAAIRKLATEVVTLRSDLVQLQLLDESTEEWIRWLADEGLHRDQPLTPGKIGLLWTVLEELAAAADHVDEMNAKQRTDKDVDQGMLIELQDHVSNLAARGQELRAWLEPEVTSGRPGTSTLTT